VRVEPFEVKPETAAGVYIPPDGPHDARNAAASPETAIR